MLWIGITGPMGSGKSTVSHLLRQMGYDVLDADQLAAKVLSPGSEGESRVLQTFGEELCGAEGHLDRRAIGRLVFADPSRLAALEAIVHPLVRQEVAAQRERLRHLGRDVAFYDVPLLFEKKMRDQFDQVLVVNAPSELRAARVKARSQLTDEEILERNARHLPAEVKEAAADFVIRNEGSLEDLQRSLAMAILSLKIPLPTPP